MSNINTKITKYQNKYDNEKNNEKRKLYSIKLRYYKTIQNGGSNAKYVDESETIFKEKQDEIDNMLAIDMKNLDDIINMAGGNKKK